MAMPTEGTATDETILQRVRKDVPTCNLSQNLGDVKKAAPRDWNICVVIDENRIVLGLLDLDAAKDVHATVEQLMQPWPQTFRPSVPIDEATEFLEQSNRSFVLVTKSTGQLIGVFRTDT